MSLVLHLGSSMGSIFFPYRRFSDDLRVQKLNPRQAEEIFRSVGKGHGGSVGKIGHVTDLMPRSPRVAVEPGRRQVRVTFRVD